MHVWRVLQFPESLNFQYLYKDGMKRETGEGFRDLHEEELFYNRETFSDLQTEILSSIVDLMCDVKMSDVCFCYVRQFYTDHSVHFFKIHFPGINTGEWTQLFCSK